MLSGLHCWLLWEFNILSGPWKASLTDLHVCLQGHHEPPGHLRRHPDHSALRHPEDQAHRPGQLLQVGLLCPHHWTLTPSLTSVFTHQYKQQVFKFLLHPVEKPQHLFILWSWSGWFPPALSSGTSSPVVRTALTPTSASTCSQTSPGSTAWGPRSREGPSILSSTRSTSRYTRTSPDSWSFLLPYYILYLYLYTTVFVLCFFIFILTILIARHHLPKKIPCLCKPT